MPEGSMPYTLEKGPYWSVIESYVNDDRDRAVEALAQLEAGASLADLPALASTTLDLPPDHPLHDGQGTADRRRHHVRQHWFGHRPPEDGQGWSDQDAYDPATNPTTGFWNDWYGDAEEILRTTLVRALRISLGVDQATEVERRRHWPIELLWLCPQPFFEGWITWRRLELTAERDLGVVTVLVSTPGHGSPLKATPLRGEDDVPPALQHLADEQGEPYWARSGYETDPSGPVDDRGMWVVSQRLHRQDDLDVPIGPVAEHGTVTLRLLHHRSEGAVVVVRPAEGEGGWGGRSYVPAGS